MGNNESTEPFTSNMYNRRVLAGEFTVVNKVSSFSRISDDFLTHPSLSTSSRILSIVVSGLLKFET
jgi:hypothetical protein